jgi:TolB protein
MIPRRALVAAIAVVAAEVGAGCGNQRDPCAFDAPGPGWLAYSSLEHGNWDVQVIRGDGTCRSALTVAPSTDLFPAWGPGALVAYGSDRSPGPGIWIHDVRAGTERRLDLGSLGAASPAFSPDGASLAFEGRGPGVTNASIYLVPAAGGTPRLLTPDASGSSTPEPHGNGGPVFTPDGTTVYFVSDRNGTYDVYRVPAAGGDAVRVTTASGILGRPAMSPDGKTLAYTRSAPGSTTEVVLLDLGSAVVTPLPGPGRSDPAFDPAGGRLAARAQYLLTTTIDLVPLDGSGALRLTTGPGPDGAPAFAPVKP